VKGQRKKTKRKQGAKAKGHSTENWSADSEKKIIAQIWDLIEVLCATEGLELVHIEFHREPGGRILRFYIDGPDGVTLDDCINISRQGGDLLDVYLESIGPYRLEVSSPGPNRPLSKRPDYERFIGRQTKIRTTQPIEGQKNFKGVLSGTSAKTVKLAVEGTIVSIPFSKIARAHLAD
jgi:ribosome maturation factor RimP